MSIEEKSSPMKPPSCLRRKFGFRLLALAIGSLIAIVIGEVTLQAFVDQEAKRLAIYDETLGWRGRPNGSGVYVRKIDNIRVPFRYNNLGFRDEDVVPKPADGRRIMMLGDSFIENLEVDYSDTFPALVERLIQQRSSNWDVAAVGSQGYSTSQQLLAFRNYQATISPDIVLLFFYCGNDFEDNLRRNFAYLDNHRQLQIPANRDPKWKHFARRSQRWLYESSHLVFLVKNSLQSIANIEITPVSKASTEADEDYKVEITEKLLCKLNEEVKATGAEFAVVVIPFRDDLVSGNDDDPLFIKSVCEEHRIKHLDLSQLLESKDFFKTDIHFNATGHEVVAHAVDAFVANSLTPY